VERLVNTTEMFVKTIYELGEEGVEIRQVRISERLGQTPTSVRQTLDRIERAGLVRIGFDRRLELTDSGRQLAVAVLRKHRLAECLLVGLVGLGLTQAHVEACRWEHVMSDEVERGIHRLLGFPTVSPYGLPIPGLAGLGFAAGGDDAEPGDPFEHRLDDYARRGGGRVEICQIGEHIQTEPVLMAGLVAAAVLVGRPAVISATPSFRSAVGVRTSAGEIDIPSDFAHSIVVREQPPA
jgi:DtxR family Mn-dependent transcriptional regulator